jgi:DNA mismatch repair ATPase MutL
LPKSVHSSLRSSVILSDLPRVIEELIYNSIDANASKVLLYMWRREKQRIMSSMPCIINMHLFYLNFRLTSQ